MVTGIILDIRNLVKVQLASRPVKNVEKNLIPDYV